jgi:hypothetical protein
MAAPPGDAQRTPFAQSRSMFTFMDAPGPETADRVAAVRELVKELEEDGWVPIGPSGRWYAERFLWGGDGRPRPRAPLKGKEADG